MTRYRPGDIVLVRFPFTDLSAVKRRPAIVLSAATFSARHGDVVLMALTSQPQADGKQRLSRWQASGLPKPTWIRSVVGTISVSMVERRLGRLQTVDVPRARLAVRQAIAGVFLD